ncbi:pentatricopeptide repeat-containing protein At5g66500, mitochondrial-like isoform X1 [Dendrobium catenatum]|uniref:Pentatricopeptide repeat-containing protein n=1 Tax=Dendrobium catenatum TaxID=906689 RepID=A0A2I0WYM1_9ASPA|nr:pentatricopeptide repeat-containing protein At5g66500, mitochondrial-like isoform X1 [Dendrobium catenatum]PKU80737.1 Pentatricopeptide repeat-containing protein [Dendrobium catenatum]
MKSSAHNLWLSRLIYLLPALYRFNSLQCLSTCRMFDEMPLWDRDTYSLNTLLSSHVRAGNPTSALLLFQKMRVFGVPLDSYSFPPVLSASSTASPSLGRQLHALMAKAGCLSSPITATALLDMYSNISLIDDALFVFEEMRTKDVVAWNALLSSLVIHNLAVKAVDAFRSMLGSGVSFTGFTLCSLLKAFAALRTLRLGRQIHAWVVITGYDSLVMATTLIDFYSSCAQVHMAIGVFNKVGCPKDSAIHNAVANACVKNGCFQEVFALLGEMRPLNEVLLTSALSACAESLNLLYGREIHCVIFRHGFVFDTILFNALMNMYAKCGNLKAAHLLFDCVGERNVISWTSIIDAYGIHGRGVEALRLFKRMEEEKASSNVSPNSVTFLSVLSACSHSGLVDEAKEFFFLMKEKHGFAPSSAHYACLIDLLGRAGRVEEAWDLFCSLNRSHNKLTSPVCVAMLNACRVSMDFMRGEVVAMHLLELDPDNPSSYVQVSNFYGAFGRWEGVQELRKIMINKGLKKELGSSQVAA